MNSNTPIASTEHISIQNNDINPTPELIEILSNILEIYRSTQIERPLVRSNGVPAPFPLHIIQERLMNMKQEPLNPMTYSLESIKHIWDNLSLSWQSSPSNTPHNSNANNNSSVLNIKQENNSSDQVDSVSSNESTLHEATGSRDLMAEQNPINIVNNNTVSNTPHNSNANNNSSVLNIKQENNLSTNVRGNNSSDQVDSVSSNESTLHEATGSRDLMAEQNPINIVNNNTVSKVRETPYFCIRKLPNIKNVFCNDDNDQTSQNNVIFICRICKNSPSTDIHSFALHMSDHSECNMHECIVCEKTFNSVVLWTDHMIYHQQQIDLNVSTIQLNPIETESNAFEPICSRNIEPQGFTNLRNKKFKISSLNDSHSDTPKLNNANKIKNQYVCRYCDEIFFGKSQCTNHEKSHRNSDNLLLQNNENIKLQPIVNQNSISIKDNNANSETMSRKQTKKNKSLSIKKTNFCNFCNRKFTKRCYFTNHMMMKHNINTNTPKQLSSIDSNESIIVSENTESTDEYDNKLSVPVINKNNNLNNHVKKNNEKKSTFCQICNTHFAHLGALTNHMRVHGNITYKCQYCYMQFNRKGLYIIHEKTHVLKNAVKNTANQNKNNKIVEVNEEPQIEHYNGFEIIHSPVDDNSSGTNLTDIEHLWLPCDVCEKKFSTPFQLNVHRKLHRDIVPYVCKICNRTYQLKFRWNWHLKGHYNKHNASLKSKQNTNNLKPNITKLMVKSISHKNKMKCQYCKKEYNSISQWKKHMKMHKGCRSYSKCNLPEFTSNKATRNSSKSGKLRCNICSVG